MYQLEMSGTKRKVQVRLDQLVEIIKLSDADKRSLYILPVNQCVVIGNWCVRRIS